MTSKQPKCIHNTKILFTLKNTFQFHHRTRTRTRTLTSSPHNLTIAFPGKNKTPRQKIRHIARSAKEEGKGRSGGFSRADKDCLSSGTAQLHDFDSRRVIHPRALT